MKFKKTYMTDYRANKEQTNKLLISPGLLEEFKKKEKKKHEKCE